MNVLLASLILAASTNLVPLSDLDRNPYLWGYYGGLWDVYNTGDTSIPPDHFVAGMQHAANVQPRDAAGNPDPNGKIAVMSAGYSNTQLAFDKFIAMAKADPRVKNDSLVFVNGAGENLDAEQWEFPWSRIYGPLETMTLPEAGVTPQQVQVIWMQQINQNPYTPLPIQYADSYLLKATIAQTLRTLRTEFPNLQIVYLSDPQYGGYGTQKFLGEPYAYEDGFADRWVILGQISFMRNGEIWDPRIWNLDYSANGTSPWVSWGPYLWANGDQPRSDGLAWLRSDFAADGNTLSDAGAEKTADRLLKFFESEPTATSWFTGQTFTNVPNRRHVVRP